MFLSLKRFDPSIDHFIDLHASTGTDLLTYKPETLRIELSGKQLRQVIIENQVTQIDVRMSRKTHDKLFVFHRGMDPHLHVKWNRDGEIVKDEIRPQ